MLSSLRLPLLCLLLPGLMACSATLRAPSTPVEAPREVVLLEHGRHSSLLLTADDRSRWRYAYGDWAWYVEHEGGVAAGARAMFRDSQGALGRQRLSPLQPEESLQAVVGVGIERSYHFSVEGSRVDTLLDSLESRFSAAGVAPLDNPQRRLSFVPHPQPYRFGQNSNHMVAEWLRALDVPVQGNPAIGRWRVQGEGVRRVEHTTGER